MRKNRYSYTLEQLKEIVASSFSYRTCLQKLGLNASGNAYTQIKKRIKENNIDITHFTGKRWNKGIKTGSAPRISLESILQGNHPTYGTSHLKYRLLKEGIFEHICSKCTNYMWCNEPIPLELDHIDGNPENHIISNLRMLCPNCHAQTPTHAGKNKRKSKD